MKVSFSKLISLSLLVLLFIPLVIEGQVVEIDNPLEADSFWELMENIVNFLFALSLPVGALMIVVAAFYFLTSGGDPEKVKKAKMLIFWTLVGIVILFLSVALIQAIVRMLGVEIP